MLNVREYKVLKKGNFLLGDYKIVPIRFEDRFLIMQWRNEQIYHLRQNKPLTKEDQDSYFENVVSKLFDQDKPDQILFSFLKEDQCIGYGGLVHINWEDKNAEISFLMDTILEKDFFKLYWITFLKLLEEVAFKEIRLHKIYTYAFDLRPKLYFAMDKAGFSKEAVLKQHGYFEGKFIDVIIHSKINNLLYLRYAKPFDAELTYSWANDSIVRMFAFTKEKIEWENHKKWYYDKINDDNCEYYILSKEGVSVGSIRFDIDNDKKAMISYLIDPAWHGNGFGKIILKYGVDKLKSCRKDVVMVYGLVQQENTASIKIFEKLGFQNTSKDQKNYRFEKELSGNENSQ